MRYVISFIIAILFGSYFIVSEITSNTVNRKYSPETQIMLDMIMSDAIPRIQYRFKGSNLDVVACKTALGAHQPEYYSVDALSELNKLAKPMASIKSVDAVKSTDITSGKVFFSESSNDPLFLERLKFSYTDPQASLTKLYQASLLFCEEEALKKAMTSGISYLFNHKNVLTKFTCPQPSDVSIAVAKDLDIQAALSSQKFSGSIYINKSATGELSFISQDLTNEDLLKEIKDEVKTSALSELYEKTKGACK